MNATRTQAQRDSAQRLRAGARRLEAGPVTQSGADSVAAKCCFSLFLTCGYLWWTLILMLAIERSREEVCAMLVARTPDGRLWRLSWHLGRKFSRDFRGSCLQRILMHGSVGRNMRMLYTLQAESIGMDVMSELTDQRDALKRTKVRTQPSSRSGPSGNQDPQQCSSMTLDRLS